MADGSLPSPQKGAERPESEGLPLHPVVESLSAELGRYLARILFEEERAAEREDAA